VLAANTSSPTPSACAAARVSVSVVVAAELFEFTRMASVLARGNCDWHRCQ
jgi:hypothetical protein